MHSMSPIFSGVNREFSGSDTKRRSCWFCNNGWRRDPLSGIVFVSTGAVDVPSVIGHVGTVPGRNLITIANFSLGRRDAPAAVGRGAGGCGRCIGRGLSAGARAAELAVESGGEAGAAGGVRVVPIRFESFSRRAPQGRRGDTQTA